jgi:hypothetical protein
MPTPSDDRVPRPMHLLTQPPEQPPSATNSQIRSRSFAANRSTHGLPDPEPNQLNDAMTA